MKYVVIIGDGMADWPLEALGGKTPLMSAHKPYMDMMAREGYCGKVLTIPDGYPSGSDVACMSIFGYSPAQYYTGRAPIEASGMGIQMEDNDVAFRCNLVYLDAHPDKTFMGDYSGGHITTEEAHVLIHDLAKELGNEEFLFFPGVSYRHVMLWRGGIWEMETTPPHDITGKEILGYLPSGKGSERLRSLMTDSRRILESHHLNRKRVKASKYPANSIWLWGQGKKAQLPLFKETHGLTGATVTAVDLVKGISRLVGFDTPAVEGATGYLDTNYQGKANKAVELLKDHDIVYVHVEAPDEASHEGNVEEKIKAIENIDREVVGTIFEKINDPIRFLIVTDHATPIALKTHYATPVPFAIYEKNNKTGGCPSGYDERAGERVFDGESLISFFIRGQLQ
jgi:2,3-bisphosphoglycerate-independent phosphoglycerate mutase